MEFKNIEKQIKTLGLKNESATILFLIGKYLGLSTESLTVEDVDIQTISRAGFLKRDSRGLILNLNALQKRDYEDEISNRLKEYRKVFKGLFTGSMGSPEDCYRKLVRWLKNNSEYTMSDVINAAEYWVHNKRMEHPDNLSLIGQANYFIYKKSGKDEFSRLSSVIDEAMNAEPVEESFDTFL